MTFDFKSYHVRSINASSEAEKTAINQELKDLYAGLNEADKLVFNQELEAFMMKTYRNIKDDYEAINQSN